jgi:hypothetical protein
MRLAIVQWVVAVGALMAGTAYAADAPPQGLELGLRTGYALPLGNSVGAFPGGTASSLSDLVTGVLPIWIDAGYRFPHVYVGAYFQYGIAFINNDKTGCGGLDCSSSDVQFGANVHYHLFPDRTLDPWGGVGVGYEFLNFKSSLLVGPEPANGF